MDVATLSGLAIGTGLILVSIALGTGFGSFLDIPSLLVTLGGTMAATLISFSLKQVLGIVTLVKQTLFVQLHDSKETIRRLVKLAGMARREGLLALEPEIDEIDDAFLQKGLSLVVDGATAESLRKVLETDLGALDERHQLGKKILDSMAMSAPAWGMIGTLMGLVQMLQTLDDPSKIGGGMAIALLTTFYGAVFANLVCGPLAAKLETKHTEEYNNRQLALEGVLAIQAGDHPRLIEDKLVAFLSATVRAELEAEKAGS